MEEHFKHITIYISVAVEAIAALIIVCAVLEAGYNLVRWLLGRDRGGRDIQNIRLRLGRWLVLSLEFLLAADILKTAVMPTWTELGKLGVIIVLRTALNFFLEYELRRVAERRDAPPEHALRPPDERSAHAR